MQLDHLHVALLISTKECWNLKYEERTFQGGALAAGLVKHNLNTVAVDKSLLQ